MGAEANVKIALTNLTVNTGAYSAGDSLLGAPAQFAYVDRGGESVSGAILEAITIVDVDEEAAELTLLFFSDTPTTQTINDAYAANAADLNLLLGIVEIETADFSDIGGEDVATVTGIDLPIKTAAGTLYMHAITRGTPTWTAATDVTVILNLVRG